VGRAAVRVRGVKYVKPGYCTSIRAKRRDGRDKGECVVKVIVDVLEGARLKALPKFANETARHRRQNPSFFLIDD
jgi:hypothetical protein